MNKKMDQKPDLLEVLRAHGVDVGSVHCAPSTTRKVLPSP
jgi:hypothetical protein